jgi:hypothetical protein
MLRNKRSSTHGEYVHMQQTGEQGPQCLGVVVDASEQDRLVPHRHASLLKPVRRLPSDPGDLIRVVEMRVQRKSLANPPRSGRQLGDGLEPTVLGVENPPRLDGKPL